MRDEIDSRFWVDHHGAFARDVDAALASLGALLSRTAARGGGQLFAVAAAFALTALTLNATALA